MNSIDVILELLTEQEESNWKDKERITLKIGEYRLIVDGKENGMNTFGGESS